MKTSVSHVKDAASFLGNNYIVVAVADIENRTVVKMAAESFDHLLLLFLALARDSVTTRQIMREALNLFDDEEARNDNDNQPPTIPD